MKPFYRESTDDDGSLVSCKDRRCTNGDTWLVPRDGNGVVVAGSGLSVGVRVWPSAPWTTAVASWPVSDRTDSSDPMIPRAVLAHAD